MSDQNTRIIEEFRADAGRVGGPFAGRDLVLITTTGAKSGRAVTTPLAFLRDGERIVLIASAGGSDKNPAWYHNLRADPRLTVEIGTDTYPGRAELVTGAERDALYAGMVALLPAFAEYERKTERRIPVFAVRRVDA